MPRFFPRTLSLLALVPALAAAQAPATPPQPGTIPQCITAITAYEKDQLAALGAGTAHPTGASIRAGQVAIAQGCLSRLSLAATPDSALIGLAALYELTNDTTALTATLSRYIAGANLTPVTRAVRYVAAIRVARGDRSPPRIALAERLLAQLDTMTDSASHTASGSLNVQKILGHRLLLAYYRGDDIDDQIERHANRIIALLPTVPTAERKTVALSAISAYTNLAEVYGDRAKASDAVALLERGKPALADLADATPPLDATLARYQQVGQTGSAIQAQHWLNAPAGTQRFTPGHGVTLLQFTAHWCGPCRKSYPAIARLQTQYGARGLTTVFATQTYGFFKSTSKLAPEQEVKADEEYFLHEHELPVQIAVYVPPAGASDTTPNPNDAAYKVSGIPQMVLLDRTGKIRMIVVGWDPATEATLARMIETLLAEKA